MEQISNLQLYKLRNSEYFQHMSDFSGLIVGITPSAIHSDTEFVAFTAAMVKLDDELRVDQGSVLTEQITQLDIDRDNTWRAIDMRLNATLLCTIPEEVEAAKRLRRVFDLYGDIRRASYNEQTGEVTNLVGDLEKPKNAGFVATCGLGNWIGHLKQLNLSFKDKQNERDTEMANKNSGNAKVVRQDIDPLYELMVERVNALISLNMQTPELENFVKELNQKIKTLNTTLAGREGRKESGQEEEPATSETV